MKKITSALLVVLLAAITISTQAFADDDSFPKGRVTAVGDEPNGDGQEVAEANQSGVTALGAGTSQVKTCKECQTSGGVLLSSTSRRASPGVTQQTGTGGSTGTKSSTDPVGTGN